MKKFLLSTCILAVATLTFAQQVRMAKMPIKQVDAKHVENVLPTSISSASPMTTFFDNDFSVGADWTIDPSSNGQNWVLGTGVPTGSYSAPMGGISSTSAANGFAMYDSDALGTSATNSQDATITYNGTVDCSSQPFVNINFESYHRPYSEEVFVDVSNDGVAWDSYQVNANLASSTTSPNPDLISVDITATAGGQATVYFRFHYVGTWDYAWMVDDVSFSQTPDNFITTNNEVVGGFWIDYANYIGAGLNNINGLDYSVTTPSQIYNHPFVIESYIKNEGISEQHVVLNYNVTGVGTASGTSPMTVLTSQQDAVFAASPSFLPAVLGSYTVDIWGEADSAGVGTTIVNSDIITKNIELTNYIYGKDLGTSNTGSRILGGLNDQNHITTRFEMYANEQLYAIRAFIGADSDIGANVKAIIYELDSTAANGLTSPLGESDNYTIAAQDIGNWIDVSFANPISLNNGFAYECGMVGFQHPTLESYIGVSGLSLYDGEHSSFDELGLSTQSVGVPTWYYITETPMVRMNFDPNVSTAVSNIENTIFNVYPNPTNGVFAINLAEISKYDITVYNVLGQIILSTYTNSMSTTIDLSSFDKGIYTVELRNKNIIFTEKIIVE